MSIKKTEPIWVLLIQSAKAKKGLLGQEGFDNNVGTFKVMIPASKYVLQNHKTTINMKIATQPRTNFTALVASK